MTVPRGNHLKRARGSFSRNHKPILYPRERPEGRNASIITSPELRPTTQRPPQPPPPPTRQSQSRPTSHRRRKRRRFSANGTSVLQNHLPVTSQTKPCIFPTPPASVVPSSSQLPPPSACSSSSRTDEEDGQSVISERLRLKMSKSSSTTAHGSHPTGQVCTFEDWQDIKELFAKAAEQYNGEFTSRNRFANHPHTPPPPCVFHTPLVTFEASYTETKNSPRNGRRRGNAVITRRDSRMSSVPAFLP